jgi:hypothetical protein
MSTEDLFQIKARAELKSKISETSVCNHESGNWFRQQGILSFNAGKIMMFTQILSSIK